MTEISPSFPESAQELLIKGPAGQLQISVDLPEPETEQGVLAVICHPHPEHGGTMHNKVVTILARALREMGAKTVTFNFRGVGDSEGSFDHGFGETDDLMAVIDWAHEQLPRHRLWLAGFSFGAWIACKASMQTQARLLLNIAPAVHHNDFSSIEDPHCPWLVIMGDEDEVVPLKDVQKWVEKHEPQPELIIMSDAGHFFHRRLMDLRGLIKNGVRRLFS